MAKFDEADPRWIVEIRDEDAHNLNQWHWTDRSLLPWCEEKLTALFPAETEFGATPFHIYFFKKVEHVKGEVMLLMRKGRAIVSYQIDLKLQWQARAKSDGEVVADGSIHLPYISDENDLDEFDVKVIMTTAENDITFPVRRSALELAQKHTREIIPNFLRELLKTYSSKHGAVVGSQSPSSSSSSSSTTSTSSSSPSSSPSSTSSSSPSSTSSPSTTAAAAPRAGTVGVPLARAGSTSVVCKKLKMEVEFSGPAAELFECFSDYRRVSLYAGSESKLEFAIGGQFSFFDHNVTGKIVDIKPRELLVFSWRLRSWPADHYSLVSLSFAPSTQGCIISMTQESIPATEYEATKDGWSRFYWDRISACFGCSHKVLGS